MFADRPEVKPQCRDIGHARCTAVRRCLAKPRFAISLQSACATLPREEPVGGMLLRLTRSMRIRVGRIIALAVSVRRARAGSSPRLGQSARRRASTTCCSPSSCRCIIEMQAGHVHGDVSHDHAGTHAHHQTAAQDAPAQHHHDGKAGPCCAMMCVSALPADLPGVAKPLQPISACAPEIVASLHSAAPPQHYRPPSPDRRDDVRAARRSARATCGLHDRSGITQCLVFRGEVRRRIRGAWTTLSIQMAAAGRAGTRAVGLHAEQRRKSPAPILPIPRPRSHASAIARRLRLHQPAPATPAPWRERNDGVAPQPKQDR